MNSHHQRVSVVLAAYNGARFLREQLDTILSQSYPVAELVIQDDGSSDTTESIVREYSERYSTIKFHRNASTLGFRDNFMSAATKTAGDLIAFSDQDDIWMPDHIETLVELIDGRMVSCGNSLIVNSKGVSLGYTMADECGVKVMPSTDIGKAYRIFYEGNAFQGCSMMVRRDFLLKAIPIPRKTKYHDLWLAANACFFGGLSYTDKIITHYRQHGDNVTDRGDAPICKHRSGIDIKIPLYCPVMSREIRKRVPEYVMWCNPDEVYRFLDEFDEYASKYRYFWNRKWCIDFRTDLNRIYGFQQR